MKNITTLFILNEGITILFTMQQGKDIDEDTKTMNVM